MCELIEAANSMPSKAHKYLQELKAISIKIKKEIQSANQNFKAGMETFLNFI